MEPIVLNTPSKTDSEKKSKCKKVLQTPPNCGSTTDSSLLSPTEFTGFTTADIKDTPHKIEPKHEKDDHHENNLHNGPPKIFPSREEFRPDNTTPVDFTSSMEQLLEKQWDQGSQFLMEQEQNFDIASLLNCLYQLQNENHQPGEYIKNLTSRRNNRLAVNSRPSLSFSNYPNWPGDNSRCCDIGDNESENTNPSPHQQTPSPRDSASPRTSGESRLSAPLQDSSAPLFPANLSSPVATNSHISSSLTTTSVTSSSSSVSYNGVQNYKHKDKT